MSNTSILCVKCGWLYLHGEEHTADDCVDYLRKRNAELRETGEKLAIKCARLDARLRYSEKDLQNKAGAAWTKVKERIGKICWIEEIGDGIFFHLSKVDKSPRPWRVYFHDIDGGGLVFKGVPSEFETKDDALETAMLWRVENMR